ncbi:MAG: response regulator [Gammaproteobacteria bacterium]|nr:response regulator [Gammaproteobacteria bacterium]
MSSRHHNTEILIVDDSSSIRATIAEYLGDEYIIYYAPDGEEGWNLLQANESIALVFTDMHMPVKDGELLLHKIREADCERIANMPVIMVTGDHESEEAKKALLNIGATDFISKPFDKIDMLSRTRSYTRFNRQIADLEKKAAYDTLTGLYSNHMLLDFGHKTISFAGRHNVDASVLYVEIADIDALIETHGSKEVGTIVSTVASMLEESIRQEELVAHLDDGRFAIVLPNTKAFMAHIVASRLKEAVEERIFTFDNAKVQVSLAVGLCSTEANEKFSKIAFEEYCVHAAHALAASLKTANKRVVRYDETFERITGDSGGLHLLQDPQSNDDADHEHDMAYMCTEYFPGILAGDYSQIPHECLSSLVGPLESFIEYAHTVIQADVKAAGK